MIIYYRGKEQLNGYIQTKQIFQGGYVAEIAPNAEEFVEWSAFDWVRSLPANDEQFLTANFGKKKLEFWQSEHGETTTTKRPPVDENGVAWSKIKRDFTQEEHDKLLKFEKIVLEGILVSIYKTRFVEKNLFPTDFEQQTWHIQEQEAKEYLSTGSSGTLLSTLADNRGISVAVMADKILSKSNDYKRNVGNLLGTFQKHRSTINGFDKLEDLREWRKNHLGWNISKENVPLDQYVPPLDPLAGYMKNI